MRIPTRLLNPVSDTTLANKTPVEDVRAWRDAVGEASLEKLNVLRVPGATHTSLLRLPKNIESIARLVATWQTESSDIVGMKDNQDIRNKLFQIVSQKMPTASVDQDMDSSLSLVDLGMTSLIAMQIHASVAKQFSIPSLPLSCVLNQPTMDSLYSAVSQVLAEMPSPEGLPSGHQSGTSPSEEQGVPRSGPALEIGVGDFGEPIAIVGTASICPGATDVESFWQRLQEGKEMTLRSIGREEASRYIKEHVEGFDSAFFGLNHSDSVLIDPQQRMFMECAVAAIQNAGLPLGQNSAKNVGVFSTTSVNTYLTHNLLNSSLRDAMATDPTEFMRILLASDKDYTSTRLAHSLDLQGPAITVQSACSSSLTAVMLACDALHNMRCDAAIVGGASIGFPLDRYGVNDDALDADGDADGTTGKTEGGMPQLRNMFSGDGICRAFDIQSKGTSPGCGSACFVLKRLSDAIRDRDRVMCCVVGGAMNNDGARKGQYSQVSIQGQVEVLRKAYDSVGGGCVPDEHLAFIEGHGTGTTLGDPVEVAALAELLNIREGQRQRHKQKIKLGSVKSNLGHLDAAAGAVGLLKACLSLEKGFVVPSINFDSPSQGVGADLERAGIEVNTSFEPLPRGRPLAGLSSWGMGGTNVHLVLASATTCMKQNARGNGGTNALISRRLFVMSAKNSTDLRTVANSMEKFAIAQNPCCVSAEVRAARLARAAFTLQCGRTLYDGARFSFAASSWREVSTRCNEFFSGSSPDPGTNAIQDKSPVLVFMFPGQGAQHLNMARQLYHCEPIFRKNIDQCCALASAYGGCDIMRLFFEPGNITPKELDRTDVVQPAVFIVSLCLARLYETEFGIRPVCAIGHSLGELVCATLSGLFDTKTALRIVVERARVMQSMPAGSMVQIGPGCPAELLREAMDLFPTLELAAQNTSSSYVLSGEKQIIKGLCKWFRSQNSKLVGSSTGSVRTQRIKCIPLASSHAFHSNSMRPAAEAFATYVSSACVSSPSQLDLAYVSNVTAQWQTIESATPDYWGDHMRGTVRFSDGIDFICSKYASKPIIFVEVGPGGSLTGLVRRHLSERDVPNPKVVTVVASLPHKRDANTDDHGAWLSTVGKLWELGCSLDFTKRKPRGTNTMKTRLPLYPMQKHRCFSGKSLYSNRKRAHINQAVEVPHEEKKSVNSYHHSLDDEQGAFEEFKSLYSGFTLIQKKRLPLRDSFFASGGSSMNASALRSKIRQKYGIEISHAEFLANSSPVGCWNTLISKGLQVSKMRSAPLSIDAQPPQPSPFEEKDPPMYELTMTKAQQAIWYEEQRSSAREGQYNMGCLLQVELQGTCTRENIQGLLQTQMSTALDRHPLLRARLVLPEGGIIPHLVVDNEPASVVKLRYSRLDASFANANDDEASASAHSIGAARQEFRQVVSEVFDLLGTEPLIRLVLCSTEKASRHAFVILVVHHIIADGAALGTLVTELLGQDHAKFVESHLPLKEQVAQFRSYVEQEAALTNSEEGATRKRWWNAALQGTVSILPTLRTTLALNGMATASKACLQEYELSLPDAKLLSGIARKLGVTPISIHLAAVACLIYRYTGLPKICIGVPHANRHFFDQHENESEGATPGPACCVAGTIPIVVDIHGSSGEGNVSFADVVKETFQTLSSSLIHMLPLGDIVRSFGDRSRDGLFQVMVVYSPSVNTMLDASSAHSLSTSGGSSAQVPLTFRIYSSDTSRVAVPLEPSTFETDASFSPTWSREFAAQYCQLLNAAIKDPESPPLALQMFDKQDIRVMKRDWNSRPDMLSPPHSHGASKIRAKTGDFTLPDLIIDAAQHVGFGAPAVLSANFNDTASVTSYGELLLQSTSVSSLLRSKFDISSKDVVALEAFRTRTTPVILIGILQSGAAYLPLSPNQPVERLYNMLREAGPKLLILESKSSNLALAAHQCGIPVLDVGSDFMLELLRKQVDGDCDRDASLLKSGRQPLPYAPAPDDVAYILYTSGSTGSPKGVEVTHRNAVSFLSAMQHEPVRIEPTDILTCVHELLFDFSVWEIFGALCNGAALCVVPKQTYLSPPDLIKLCDKLGVTVLSQTPAAFAALESEDWLMGRKWARSSLRSEAKQNSSSTYPYLQSLRSLVFAGDKLDFSRLCRWFERHNDASPHLYNCYGITETSVFSTCRRISHVDAIEASSDNYPYFSLIGKPMTHNDFVVLNAAGRVAPRGVSGELFIGGLAVAQGYRNREELTQERFLRLKCGNVIDSENPGRMYFRTGDLVKYTETGEFDFLGRVDQQLKVRGFRVEAFEIEQVILSHPDVKNAVAVVTKSPALLVVFFTLKDVSRSVPSNQALQLLAKSKLPDYMVPQEFLHLEEGLPTTPNRKVDRKTLSQMDPRKIKRRERTRLQKKKIETNEMPIEQSWNLASHLLRLLCAGRPVTKSVDSNDVAPLPKFSYPSGGSLYPVQAYFLCGGEAWYYNPLQNSLLQISSTPPKIGKGKKYNDRKASSDSSIILVGNVACVEPLYPDGGEYFASIECGCVYEVLSSGAPAAIHLDARPLMTDPSMVDMLSQKLRLVDGCQPLFQINMLPVPGKGASEGLFMMPAPQLNSIKAFYTFIESRYLKYKGHTFDGGHSTEAVLDLFLVPRLRLTASPCVCVADFGSGLGGPAVHLARQLKQCLDSTVSLKVSGVTLTENAVNISKNLARHHSVSECTDFFIGDYHNLKGIFSSGEYDGVIITNALCHSQEPSSVLSEAHRCLKDDGILLVKDLYSISNINIETSASKHTLLKQFSENLHMAFHESSAILNMVKECGFTDCEFIPLHEYKSVDGSLSFVQACFNGSELTEFGEVVLKDLPAFGKTLEEAPFREGVWIARKRPDSQ